MSEKIKKVILTRLEELPMKDRVEYGLSGRAVVEVTKNSPIAKTIVPITGGYMNYFNDKIKESGLKPEDIRDLGKEF